MSGRSGSFAIWPAIDLKGGQAVRLVQGEMARATVFNPDPADQAVRFRAAGFDRLHVVDLDGAFAGESRNGAAVRAILAAAQMPVQLGGGIRTMDQIEAWLEAGVARVILGTVAVRDPGLVRRAARAFPGRIAVGIDARDGHVAVEGWAEASTLSAAELGARFADAGVAALIYTDIARDGTGRGINAAATVALARAVELPVIASGGLGGMDDIEALLGAEVALAGVIAGRALYDGRLDAAAALARVRARAAGGAQ